MWLAEVGKERIDEIIDPELTIDRALETYLKKGYTREWINQRLQAIQVRKDLTDAWQDHGVREGKEYAILTNEISKAWSGMTVRQYKDLKKLKKENLRDNMSTLELVLNMLAEATVTDLLRESIAAAIDNAAFTQVPENTVIAYRYDIRGASFADTQLVIYADGKTAYIPNMLEDMPEVFAWELFKEAYKILSQPASLKEGLARYKNSGETICVYDAKGVLVSSVRIQSVSAALSKILTDYTDDTKRRRASGSFLSAKSVHEGKRLLYRYTIWGGEDNETIRIYIYEDTGKAVIAGRFPNVMDCTLSEKGYALFKNPKKLIEKLEATAGQLSDIR